MSRPMWTVKIAEICFPYRFFLARFTKVPIIGKIIDSILFMDDRIIYLPKDNVIPVNRQLQKPDDVVLPSKVIEHFIEKATFHWIMNVCICREASQCKNYPIDLGCLFLGNAAMGINPKLGRRVTKEEAIEHIRKCGEAGLVHMIGRNRLDTVWLGVGPGTQLLSICNCCPCCCLWRMLPYTAAKISENVKKMPGVEVRVTDRCIGCGTCTQGVCFVDAIHLKNGKAHINEDCRGCGRCVDICPNDAIDLIIEESSFIQDSIDQIAEAVDVT